MTQLRIRTHPGEILLQAFMRPRGVSADALARDLHMPPSWITAVIAAENPRAVTPDMALRLARYFGTTPVFWINLQSAYDISAAEKKSISHT